MKIIHYLILLIISKLFLVEAKAEWTKVTESNNGQTFYVDLQTIHEKEGQIFF